MTREELITFTRKQIQRLKEQGVPTLVRDGNKKKIIEKLIEIIEGFDYSPFEECPQPKFTCEELGLTSSDDSLSFFFYMMALTFKELGLTSSNDFNAVFQQEETGNNDEWLDALIKEDEKWRKFVFEHLSPP